MKAASERIPMSLQPVSGWGERAHNALASSGVIGIDTRVDSL